MFDVVLIAAGRVPNVDGMGLETADVKHDKKGIIVNKNLRTGNSKIWACGDCTIGPNFTHNSDA